MTEVQMKTFNTDLSTAADDYIEAVDAIERAKGKKDEAEIELVRAMKKHDMLELNLGNGRKLCYQFKDAEEKVSVRKCKVYDASL